jgi:hypothetical protein
MRRVLLAVAIGVGVLAVPGPVAAQNDGAEPPTERDAAIIAETQGVIDSFECPVIDGLPEPEVTLPAAQSLRNNQAVPVVAPRFRCTYGSSRRSVEITYSVKGIEPERICTNPGLPYDGFATVLSGRPLDPLAISAEITTFRDDEEAIRAALRRAMQLMFDRLSPFAETCPTPLDFAPFDDATGVVLTAIDDVVQAQCGQLDLQPLGELGRDFALSGVEIRAIAGASDSSGNRVEKLAATVVVSCRWGLGDLEVRARVDPQVISDPEGFDESIPECSGPDQVSAPLGVTVVVNANFDELRAQLEPRATAIADVLASVAIDCDVERAAVEEARADQVPPPPVIAVECPAVPEMDPTFFSQIEGGRQQARMSSGIPRTYPGIDGRCEWELVGAETTTTLRVELNYLSDGQSAIDATKLCSVFDIETTADNFGRLVSPSRAAFIDTTVGSPTGDTIAIGDRVAAELLAIVEPLARTCEDVPDASIESLLTPLPDYLAAAFAAGSEGRFGVAAPPADPTDDPGAESVAGGEIEGGAVSSVSSPAGDPWYELPLEIARVLMLIVSLLALLVAFLVIRRPTRIRPVMEGLRLVSTLGGAVVMFVVFSTGAPVWAVAVAVVAGAGLGILQGRNLVVTLKEKGLYAQRSAIAIAAFAAGLVLTQIAGLLNRTGAISIGLALSFLSAAMTAGLIVGRRPAAAMARAAGVAGIVIVVIVLVGPTLSQPSSAQTEETNEAADLLNASLDWDQVNLSAGITVEGLTLSVPPGLASPPEPITRELVDAPMGLGPLFNGTESFTFELDSVGLCCNILYSASGTRTTVRDSGWVNIVDLEVAPSLVGSVRPFGAQDLFGPSVITFGTTEPDGEGCRRPVSEPTADVEVDNADVVIDGVAETMYVRPPQFFAPCELDLTLADADAISPPPPAFDAAERMAAGRPCPVNQEVIDTFGAASTFPGANTDTMMKRFLQPNATACSSFGLAFGDEAPGGTRNEITYYLEPGPDGERNVFAEDSDEYLNFLPRNDEIEVVCDVADTGLPIDPTGSECAYTSFHPAGDGIVTIHTDYDSADGPNVLVRAVYPAGIFRYRCHHCEPGDPAIGTFLQSAAALAQLDPGDRGAVADLNDAAGQLSDENRAAADDDNDDGLSDVEAAWAGLAGLLAAMGISASTLAEAGVRPEDILRRLTPEERAAARGEEPPLPRTVRGPGGEPLEVAADGTVEFWDENAGEMRTLPAAEADRVLTIQRGDHGIFDPRLGRNVYLGSADEVDAYAEDLARRTSADFNERAEQSWADRQDEFLAGRAADAQRMAEDRAAIEAFEEAQARRVEQVNEGILRIDDDALRERIVAAQASGNFQELEDTYYDWLFDRMRSSRAEAAVAQGDAARWRAAELTARGLGAASRAGMTVAGGPLGVAYTAAGLAVISGAEEGYAAYYDGRELAEIAQRTGFGVVLGVRDAMTGRLGQLPQVHAAGAIYITAVGDSLEAYTRGRMDGMTYEQAQRAAGIAFAGSVTSEVVGGGFDAVPPGLARDVGQFGTTMAIGGTSSWASGGSFTDGALDAGAGFLGGRAGGAAATGRAATTTDITPDIELQRSLDRNEAAADVTVPIERQGESVQQAWAQRQEVDAPVQTRLVADEDGRLQRVEVEPTFGSTVEVSDQRTVLEGLTRTADSRTGKQADQAVQDVVNNTRSQIYEGSDQRTILGAQEDPRLQAMLEPGDEVMMDTFSTPGKPPSLGADRDARMVIVRPDPEAPNGRRLVEVPLEIWEQQAYSEFAAEATRVYGEQGFPPGVQADIDGRIARLTSELDPADWSPSQIRDRAIGEAHNQLFTDRGHPEASVANTDQTVANVSVANNRTVEDVTPALRDSGLVREGDLVTMRESVDGPQMVITTAVGDELVVPRSMWEESLTSNRSRFGDETVEVQTNITPEALRAGRGQAVLSDPADFARMWDEKSRFYAGLNDTEAVAQSQKGIAQLVAIREGYRRQGLEPPPISAQDQRAIQVVLDAQVGTGAAPKGVVEAQLQAVYGADTSLADALGRVAMLQEDLALARDNPNPIAPGAVTSGSLIRAAVSPGSTSLPEEELS